MMVILNVTQLAIFQAKLIIYSLRCYLLHIIYNLRYLFYTPIIKHTILSYSEIPKLTVNFWFIMVDPLYNFSRLGTICLYHSAVMIGTVSSPIIDITCSNNYDVVAYDVSDKA
jgi:hypothetical protein